MLAQNDIFLDVCPTRGRCWILYNIIQGTKTPNAITDHKTCKLRILVTKSSYSEPQLVEMLRERKNSGFAYLYLNYSNALYGEILGIVREHATAEDVLQEVFINIFRKIESYDTSYRLYTWMLSIARNLSIDEVKSKKLPEQPQERRHFIGRRQLAPPPAVEYRPDRVMGTLHGAGAEVSTSPGTGLFLRTYERRDIPPARRAPRYGKDAHKVWGGTVEENDA